MTDLLDWTPPPLNRGGKTFDPQRDGERLDGQAGDVWRFVADQEWHTLREISLATGHPEASVSARLRDFRRQGRKVEREYVMRGLWKYRVTA